MFKIKQAAVLTGFSEDTLRFYHKRGLAEPSCRTEAGYRLYSEEDIARLRFIKHAKEVGFSLEAISDLLDIRLHKDQKSCEDVKVMTAAKLKDVDQRIKELQRIRQALQRLHDRCCGGDEAATQCTILQTLEGYTGDPL
jgi:MerR family Zn(II)-responsive transcriptional regulator of zntA